MDIELVRLQVFLGEDNNLETNFQFHKGMDKKKAIQLLNTVIEELEESIDEQNNCS